MKDFIEIGENYRVTSDGKQNLVLHERYEKTESRGKDAVPTGEFDFRRLGYFRNMKHIGNYLADLEEYKCEGSELENVVSRIEKLRDKIMESMSKISVTWIE